MVTSVPRSRRKLIAAGATDSTLDQDLRARRSVAVFRGVHVAERYAGALLTRVRAGLETQGPHVVVAHRTAACLHAFRWIPDAWHEANAVVHVAVPAGDAHRHRAGLRLHRRNLHPCDVAVVSGVPCMSAARTLVELARDSATSELVVVQILDGALRDGKTTRLDVLACLARMPGERGVDRARRLVDRSREGVDSPQETAMRLMLVADGISDLDVGIEIRDDDGEPLARGDLGSRRLLIWGEYDGFDSHSARAVFRRDRVGDRWLERRGWLVMRFVDSDLRRPAATCREWRQAVADAPARIAAMRPDRSPEVAEARRLLGLAKA